MIRIAKRADVGKREKVLIRTVSIALALLSAGFLILLIDLNPLAVYRAMFEGAVGTPYRIRETIIKAIPLIITSLGITIAFKMKFWNIGAEGQIMMGAFSASYVALNWNFLPRPILLLTMAVAGVIGGGLWALIPAFLKAKWSTNETIVTLMLNYVAIKWVTFLQFQAWKDPAALGFPKIAGFSPEAILPSLFGIHIGWIIALVLVFAVHLFMNKSKKGFEIAVLGESENTARYAGIDIFKTILVAIFISGGIAGLSGMIQVSAVARTLSVELSAGVGFTAIITTWLSGLKPFVLVAVALLFAVMKQGGAYIQSAFGIPSAAAQLLEALILFFVLGSEFFIQYKVIITGKIKNNTLADKEEK